MFRKLRGVFGTSSTPPVDSQSSEAPGQDAACVQKRADMQARRGFAQHTRGYGASAVLDLDAAVTAYHPLVTESKNKRRQLELARVLTMNAVVQYHYGDPDLAAASADLAMKLYTSNPHGLTAAPPDLKYANYLRLAAQTASEIHAAHGRYPLALVADAYCVNAARVLAGERKTEEDIQQLAQALIRQGLHLGASDRQSAAEPLIREGVGLSRAAAAGAMRQWKKVTSGHSPLLVTLAKALDAAQQELGTESVPYRLKTTLTKPVFDLLLLTPSDRCKAEDAADYASELAEVCLELLPQRRAEGLKIGLEAHYLFSVAARGGYAAKGNAAAVWAQVRWACAQVYAEDGRAAMAEDLARD